MIRFLLGSPILLIATTTKNAYTIIYQRIQWVNPFGMLVRIEHFVISIKIQRDYNFFCPARNRRRSIIYRKKFNGLSKALHILERGLNSQASQPDFVRRRVYGFFIHGTQFHLPVSTVDHYSPTNRWPSIWWDSKMNPTHPMWGDRATNVAT